MVKQLAILILLLASRADGATAWPFCCCAEVRNGIYGGSATVAAVSTDGKSVILLSCHHVFDEGVSNPKVRYCDESDWKPCKVLGFDEPSDLSALMAARPQRLQTPKGIRAARQSDGVLLACGFPYYDRGNVPHWTKGRYLGYSGVDVHFDAHPVVHSGFSGGGLFAPDGCLVGVVCGYGTNYSYAPSGVALERFAARWIKGAK